MFGSCLRTWVLVVASMVAGLLLAASAASAYTFGSDVTPIGPQEMVLDANPVQPPCGDNLFFQDAATRGLRDSSGRESLIISNAGIPGTSGAHTRRLLGAGGTFTNAFSIDCTAIHSSHKKSNPGTFDNWEWLVSPFTEDGQTVHALVHNEYHGWEFPGQCPVTTFEPKCWYNAITLAKSTNRGDSYSHASSEPVANHLIATIPYQYNPNGPSSKGYFQPTNIVKKGGYYYSIFRVERYPNDQPNADQPVRAACLMRTNNLDDPDSWRAWDGNENDPQGGFTVDFVDPYAEAGTFVPLEHRCEPVSPNTLGLMANNLVYSRYFNRYMIVDQNVLNVNGVPTQGVFYSLSYDLIHWDPPKLLMKAPFAWDYQCGDPDLGIRVPSLIDPNSTDRNFNTIGQTAHMYFVQSHFQSSGTCQETLDRDVVRIKVRFDAKPQGDRLATLEDGQVVNSSTGFDFASGSGGGFDLRTGGSYEGNNYVQATYISGPNSPHGWINTPGWFNGTDVWYGSAFFITNGFAAAHDNGTILEWSNAFGTSKGGISLGADHQWRVTHNSQTLGPTFSLPEAQWIWLEVHQKLESDPAKSPLSEVFLNGRPVSSSAAVNSSPDTSLAPVRLKTGFVRLSGQPSVVFVDRTSTSWTERGPLGAPPTPGSFSGSEQNTLVTLYWYASPPAGGGFRVYKQNPNGTWSLRWNNLTTTALFESGLTNCTRYRYRVSAFDALGRESIKSEPLELMPRSSQGCPPT